VTYENIWQGKGIYIRLDGEFTAQDAIASNMEIYNDARFQACQYQLVDALGVDSGQLSLDALVEAMEAVAGMDHVAASYRQDMQVAFVTNHPAIREIFSQYTNTPISPGWVTKIFDSLEDARDWLGIEA